jgi:hypothetical protein
MTEAVETMRYLDRLAYCDGKHGRTYTNGSYSVNGKPCWYLPDIGYNICLDGGKFHFRDYIRPGTSFTSQEYSGFELLEKLARENDDIARQLSEPMDCLED